MNSIYSQFSPNLFALHMAIQSAVVPEQKTAPEAAPSTPVSFTPNSEALQNPRWISQYAKWKKDSFGKTDQWKDANIAAHLKVFREHDKSVQSELGIKDYALTYHVETPEGRASTREQIRLHYEKKYGIDPDKTFLMTFAYNVRGHTPPYPGTVVSKISLTDAAIKNLQDTPGHPQLPKTSFNKHASNPPPIEIVDSLTIGSQRNSGRHGYLNNSKGLNTQQYEGIYVEPGAGKKIYDASNQSPISPKSFREYVWDTSFSKSHKANLDSFWNGYRDTYTTLSKMSFTSAAHKQFAEGSLTREGRDIALRATNISTDKPLDSLTAKDFQQAYAQDPNLDIKELAFEGRVASGIMSVTDKTTQKTLLYIPGNSSPIHEFANLTMMRKWLTEQMTDKAKRDQFAEHFKLSDRTDSVWESGIDVHLEKVGRFSSLHTDWPEDKPFGGKTIEGDPFQHIQSRVEAYTYNNTDAGYVSNDDVKKKNVLTELKSISGSLIVLAPVSLAFPPLGVALLLFDGGIAATEIGFGIDDHVKNRPGAADRITFGSLNAVEIVTNDLLGRTVTPFIKP
ncbi:hypothetical protein JTY93_10750 [Pseudomonas hygromyciniae]|uniref:Dermonecrotic toxin N-terminal domain-containing protein n=1 Tax=Pseudomonas hygromyciniae TaxID=2812000 RepID=A0ABX7K760_9PSED|nr:DUF6543 domain-containing protein [Pseudomonas hygromyciniae]MBN0980986.1 hypothetical protein [Pseudomonas hygromyciniae]QSB41781.1 hypothetical protein JTY93_10750 [Pseudomonas hygromyciniae]